MASSLMVQRASRQLVRIGPLIGTTSTILLWRKLHAQRVLWTDREDPPTSTTTPPSLASKQPLSPCYVRLWNMPLTATPDDVEGLMKPLKIMTAHQGGATYYRSCPGKCGRAWYLQLVGEEEMARSLSFKSRVIVGGNEVALFQLSEHELMRETPEGCDPNTLGRLLEIKNLPLTADSTDQEVAALFTDVGTEIEAVTIVPEHREPRYGSDHQSPPPLKYKALVSFATRDQAYRAMVERNYAPVADIYENEEESLERVEIRMIY